MRYPVSIERNKVWYHYYQIEGWMASWYNFSPNELLIFALVWHWFFVHECWFVNSNDLISKVTGIPIQQIGPIFGNLFDRGIFLKKQLRAFSGVFYGYVPNPDTFPGFEKKKWIGALLNNFLDNETGVLRREPKQIKKNVPKFFENEEGDFYSLSNR